MERYWLRWFAAGGNQDRALPHDPADPAVAEVAAVMNHLFEAIVMPDTRPNILLISVDQWAGRFLGCAGHTPMLSPTLDQLAACGVRFSNAYSAHPVCIPARRTLMTGTTARTHGDRVFSERMEMPDPAKIPTLAQCLAQAGYQAFAVGKLHVYPQRDRIGFHDVILNEEGRHQFGAGADDFELHLADHGFGGQEFAHGMNNNDYIARPWHLPEAQHPTAWTAREMCRTIRRRDPRKPGFWFMSFNHPHPPVQPLDCYLRMYGGETDPAEPFIGDWARERESMPFALRNKTTYYQPHLARGRQALLGRQAFFAMCTHIDHQIRVVIGYLRENKLLDNTAIVFTSDHGDMLGRHGLWDKSVFYEESAKVPLIFVPPKDDARVQINRVDDRLVEWRDIMPTLLDVAGVPIPSSVEGVSMLTEHARDELYGEVREGLQATRMMRDRRYKLIYYAAGNVTQLFDMESDPNECRDLSADPAHAAVRDRLTHRLIDYLYGEDLTWIKDGKLVGVANPGPVSKGDRNLHGQRGLRYL